ncbi:MAG: trypsin-like peptidase domain-containing protein [Elusimicrobia bacterium]|nr:trypsin-like peptidase domain-containing protein [Elusimicrobiota bacterium]
MTPAYAVVALLFPLAVAPAEVGPPILAPGVQSGVERLKAEHPQRADELRTQHSFHELVEQVSDTAVSVMIKGLHRTRNGLEEHTRSVEGGGSGFIVDAANGLVVTNAHVAENGLVGFFRRVENGKGEDVEVLRGSARVRLAGGRILSAEIVGFNRHEDLALLKVDPAEVPLKAAALGDDKKLKVGEAVLVIGGPRRDHESVSQGIVSALNRKVDGVRGVIQHDAAFNPGNSGGPLYNMKGEVVGVNTWYKNDGQSKQWAGMSYSVPITTVRKLLDLYRAEGRMHYTQSGVLVDAWRYGGLQVDRVQPGAPLETRNSVYSGDIITAVDDLQVYRVPRAWGDGDPEDLEDDYVRYIRARKPGDTVVLTIRRGGFVDNFEVKVPIRLY